MRKWLACLIITASLSLAAFAAGKSHPANLVPATPDPKVELQNLTAQILAAKAAGQTPDPALYARYSELMQPAAHSARTLDQGNDACPATTISSLPFTDSGTTTGRTNDWGGSCVGSGSPDVIYRYTPAVTGEHTISLCGSTYDTGLIIRTGGDCPGSAEVGCNDDYCDLQSQVTVTLTRNTVYYIIVDGYGGYAGDYILHVTGPAVQTGETCADALPLTVPARILGNSSNFANDYDYACPYANSTSPDVVYSYTPTSNQAVTFSLCESGYDTKLYIYEGTCTGTPIACNDDANPCPLSYGSYRSRLECVQLTGGTTYYVVVDGYAGASGDYVLTTESCSTGLPNDDCTNALPITVNAEAATCGTTLNATLDCEQDPIPEVWYTFTTTQWMDLSVSFCGTPGLVGVIAQIFAGSCCGTSISYDGNDFTHCSDGQHTLYYHAIAPGVYYLPVGLTPAGAYYVKVNGTVINPPVDCHEADPMDNRHCNLEGGVIHDYAENSYVIRVPNPYHILGVNVGLNLTHTWDADLQISLESPSGTTVMLSQDHGGSGDNYTCTVFDTAAFTPIAYGNPPFSGSFVPDQPLSLFNGENAQGDWILHVNDMAAADSGYLDWVCLTFGWDHFLSVELRSFEAVPGDNHVQLNWSTASESNNHHFEILRDGVKIAQQLATAHPTGADYSFTDHAVTNGTTYSYSLVSVDVNGNRQEVATTEAVPTFNAATITEYALHQNYPNPFNPTTSIAVDLVASGNVSLKVYNLMGQEVASLVNGNLGAGRHIVNFNAAGLSSGVYLYRLNVNGFAAEKKMLLMK